MVDKVDAETHAILTEADHVRNLTTSDGWRIVKSKLDARILDLQNINNLDLTTTESAIFDLKARKMASDLLFAWLKDDIYGFIQQQESNSASLIDKPREDFIDRG